MNTAPTRFLSEKELGTLYVTNRVPLHFDQVLRRARMTAEAEAELHQMIGQLPPDEALLSLALCGRQLYSHIAAQSVGGEEARPMLAELKNATVQITEWLGRGIIDMQVYGLDYAQDQLGEMLLQIPDYLCVLSSLYQEVASICEGEQGWSLGLRLANLLHYQAETHADTAQTLVEGLSVEEGEAELIVETARETMATPPRDTVPLPIELQENITPPRNNVVAFSLFDKKPTARI